MTIADLGFTWSETLNQPLDVTSPVRAWYMSPASFGRGINTNDRSGSITFSWDYESFREIYGDFHKISAKLYNSKQLNTSNCFKWKIFSSSDDSDLLVEEKVVYERPNVLYEEVNVNFEINLPVDRIITRIDFEMSGSALDSSRVGPTFDFRVNNMMLE